MAEGMSYPFDRVAIHRDTDIIAVIRLRLDTLRRRDNDVVRAVLIDDWPHTADYIPLAGTSVPSTSKVVIRSLNIRVVRDGKIYEFVQQINGEIEDQIRNEVSDGYVDVTITKTTPFRLGEAFF